jgi:hypothetical protein
MSKTIKKPIKTKLRYDNPQTTKGLQTIFNVRLHRLLYHLPSTLQHTEYNFPFRKIGLRNNSGKLSKLLMGIYIDIC